MKKIFYILMSAVVALGAVACENAYDDNNLGTNDKVSITVTLDEATRVAFGEVVEGGQKLVFEEGDQLYVVSEWSGADGYFFTFEKNEGGAYVFTCEAEGVGAIVGTKQTIFHLGYTGGMIDAEGNEVAPSTGGYRCNTAAESIKGVGMVASTSNFGEGTISMQVSPILKFSSEYPVTFTSGDTSLFFYHTGWYWGSFKEYTTKTTGTDIYIPLYQPRSNVTFSASIKGEVVKTKVMNFEAGKIYNLGTLEANKVELDTDVANITIDSNFSDWDDVEKCVATSDAEGTPLKTFKAYADKDNVYFYVKFDHNQAIRLHVYLDLDNNDATGEKKTYWSGYAYEWYTENRLCKWSGDACDFRVYSSTLYSKVAGVGNASVSINSQKPVALDATTAETEMAFSRADLDKYIGADGYISVAILTMDEGYAPNDYLPCDGKFLKVAIPAAE